jgi:hypothetical protein
MRRGHEEVDNDRRLRLEPDDTFRPQSTGETGSLPELTNGVFVGKRRCLDRDSITEVPSCVVLVLASLIITKS